MTRLIYIGFLLVSLELVNPSFVNAQRFPTVDAADVPSKYLRSPKKRKLPSLSQIYSPSNKEYLLDAGDTLAIFIDGVLGQQDSIPPINFPPPEADIPPSVGHPVVVRESGQIDLPFVQPINVRGLTVEQTKELITRTYRDGKNPILQAGRNRIMVAIMRKRLNRVLVVRQDGPSQRVSSDATRRSDQSATGSFVQLQQGENNVLNALIHTGGLPGVNENAEIQIQRPRSKNEFPRLNEVSFGNAEFPRSFGASQNVFRPSYSKLSIPIGSTKNIDQRHSELRGGDIVVVESRPTEIYYTAGLLTAGQHLLPRDIDLDVLEAVSRSGGNLSTRRNVQPTELVVLRRLMGNRQIPIRIDLNRAVNDPSQRILVAPNDILILRHKPTERLLNFGNQLFNAQLIR